ncbi:DUF6925 family protein [Achromobacter denitrificans]
MNPTEFLDYIEARLKDSQTAWSIGTHGVSAEFMWEKDEALDHHIAQDAVTLTSSKGAMHIHPQHPIQVISYETTSADRGTRHSNFAFCVPTRNEAARAITSLGEDRNAIRSSDRQDQIFNLGLGAGLIDLCVRTSDPDLISLLQESSGQSLLAGEAPDLMPMIMEKQPHRIMLSPLGRIEVYQAIPPSDGVSPEGPHTHVFPAVIAEGLLHSKDLPIPDGLQSVLSMHPRPAL